MKKIMLSVLLGLFMVSLLSGQVAAEKNDMPIKSVYFKMTIMAQGIESEIRVGGKYWVKSGKTVVAKGEFKFVNIGEKGKGVFNKEFAADSIDWQHKGLEWNFNGNVYYDESTTASPIGSMNMSTFEGPVAGIGFKVIIDKNKHVKINNQIYDKK